MSGRPSDATEKALRLVLNGMAPFAAARKVGVSPSTVYRSIAGRRKRSRLTGKIIPRCHCGKAAYSDGLCYGHFQAR